jgi:precorrin-6B methylase 1
VFQVGRGVQDVSENYRRHGRDIVLERYRRTPDDLAAALARSGLTQVARLVRAAARQERDAQAVLIAQA